MDEDPQSKAVRPQTARLDESVGANLANGVFFLLALFFSAHNHDEVPALRSAGVYPAQWQRRSQRNIFLALGAQSPHHRPCVRPDCHCSIHCTHCAYGAARSLLSCPSRPPQARPSGCRGVSRYSTSGQSLCFCLAPVPPESRFEAACISTFFLRDAPRGQAQTRPAEGGAAPVSWSLAGYLYGTVCLYRPGPWLPVIIVYRASRRCPAIHPSIAQPQIPDRISPLRPVLNPPRPPRDSSLDATQHHHHGRCCRQRLARCQLRRRRRQSASR